MTEKACVECKSLKPLTEFFKHPTCSAGVFPQCKECKVARTKWKRQNGSYRTKHLEYVRSRTHLLSGRFSTYKASAKSRRISFELSLDEFKSFWKKPCYYCGDSISTIGLDRVDSSKGYVAGNVVSCCTVCNYAKRKLSQETFINHCKKVATRHD